MELKRGCSSSQEGALRVLIVPFMELKRSSMSFPRASSCVLIVPFMELKRDAGETELPAAVS